MLQIKSAENFQFLRKPVDRKAWGSLPPTIINAFYEPSQNQISIRNLSQFHVLQDFSSISGWYSSNAIF
jgi:hypothetical protein